ncbi:hypothetical protein Tco_1419768 [Tanacetum coccineum]
MSIHNSENGDDYVEDNVTLISKLDIKGKNKIGFIDGTCKRSNTNEVLGTQWDKINTLKQNGSSIADYYHKLNALWRQFDAMIELPKCVCNASESSILSREVLPDVRTAYATISSEESHRVAAGSVRNNQNTSNGTLRSNHLNNNRKCGGSALVCENCGFNGHTIDRCFKIIRYPADFGKKKSG